MFKKIANITLMLLVMSLAGVVHSAVPVSDSEG